MNPISRQRFDALAGYARQPSVIPLQECEWYEIQAERLLGAIILEGIDAQFGGIVLGKDRNGRFRWVDGTHFFDDIASARRALSESMDQQSAEPDAAFEQGDERKQATALLAPIVPEEQMGRLFRLLINSDVSAGVKLTHPAG